MKGVVMELKPCPFCGGQVFFHHNLLEATGENQIECETCGTLVCFSVDLNEEHVEKLWNTRPDFHAGIKAGARSAAKVFRDVI